MYGGNKFASGPSATFVQVSQIQDQVSSLETQVKTNSTSISTNAGQISSNTTLITQLNDTVTNVLSPAVTQNKSDIAQNQKDIAQNKSGISDVHTQLTEFVVTQEAENTTLAGGIEANASDIAALVASNTARDTNIAQNTTDVASMKTDLTTLKADSKTQAGEISTLETEIATLIATAGSDLVNQAMITHDQPTPTASYTQSFTFPSSITISDYSSNTSYTGFLPFGLSVTPTLCYQIKVPEYYYDQITFTFPICLYGYQTTNLYFGDQYMNIPAPLVNIYVRRHSDHSTFTFGTCT